jgi:glutathione S-transferase
VTDLVLVTIPFSHYCEKARWALDRAGLRYDESAHLPLFHYPSALAAGGGKTVPVLKTAGRTLRDSTDILRWVDAQLPEARRLFPDEPGLHAEVSRWEDLFDDKLGPAARRWGYGHLLPDTALLRTVLQQNVSTAEAVAIRGTYPILRALIRRGLNITPKTCARSLERIHGLFAAVSDGREFLVGARLTAADVAFAALSAPALFPDRYTRWLCAREQLPAAMRAEVDRLRATPAGAYALRLYAQHR